MLPKYASYASTVAAISVAVAGPASAANFVPFVLQAVGGGSNSEGLGINDSDQIVGSSDTATGALEAVLYDGSTSSLTLTLAGTALQDLGGGDVSEALGINASGQIVGYSGREAVLWSASSLTGTTLQNVGGFISRALGINASGQIVGFSNTATGGTVAVLWPSNGTGMRLQDVGGGDDSEAFGINEKGQIVGFSNTATGGTVAVLWSSNGTGMRLQDVGGGDDSRALGINEKGQIVGLSGQEAVLWSASTLTGMALQNVSGAGFSQANAINDSGQIVGASLTANGGQEAVLWSSSTDMPTNLAAFLGSDWSNTEATAINDSGDIVGFGSFKGSEATGFLLIPTLGAPAPVPEPSTRVLALLGFGALGLVGYRQTRRMNQAA